MAQIIKQVKQVKLYDDRRNIFGDKINNLKDVYIEIEIDGELLSNNTFNQLKDLPDNQFTSNEKQTILKYSRALLQDRLCNLYIINLTNNKIAKYSFD